MKIFFEIMWAFVSWLKIPICLIIGLIVLFFILVYANVLIGLLQGKRLKKGEYHRIKKRSVFKRLFMDLPYRISEDMFARDPEEKRTLN